MARYDAKKIDPPLSPTAPGEVRYLRQQSRGWRAYINGGGVSVAGDFHRDADSARDDLAAQLILRGVDVPGLTD